MNKSIFGNFVNPYVAECRHRLINRRLLEKCVWDHDQLDISMSNVEANFDQENELE